MSEERRSDSATPRAPRHLAKLNFIALKEGSSGPASYALIYDPYKVIKWHVENKTPGVRQDKYNALLERAAEIKEHSLSPPAAPPAALAPAVPVPPPSNWPGGVDPNAAKAST